MYDYMIMYVIYMQLYVCTPGIVFSITMNPTWQ